MIEVDEIGSIAEYPAEFNDDDELVKPARYFKGWHVNTPIRSDHLKSFEVHPKNPERIYSGGNTTFLRFESKSQFDSVMASITDIQE